MAKTQKTIPDSVTERLDNALANVEGSLEAKLGRKPTHRELVDEVGRMLGRAPKRKITNNGAR